MSEVCRAINAELEAEGYGEFCHPPHIRRRGHGLGFASVRPGDVALDNPTVLEPDMLFMIHPNQYLPETGYLLCGEPAVITARGAVALTAISASEHYCLALKSDGSVWNLPVYGGAAVPAGAASIIAIAAAPDNNLALSRDGTILAWGDNTFGQTNVPVSLTNAVAVATGGSTQLALRPNSPPSGTPVAGDGTPSSGGSALGFDGFSASQPADPNMPLINPGALLRPAR